MTWFNTNYNPQKQNQKKRTTKNRTAKTKRQIHTDSNKFHKQTYVHEYKDAGSCAYIPSWSITH